MAREPCWEPLSTNGEHLKQWSVPGVTANPPVTGRSALPPEPPVLFDLFSVLTDVGFASCVFRLTDYLICATCALFPGEFKPCCSFLSLPDCTSLSFQLSDCFLCLVDLCQILSSSSATCILITAELVLCTFPASSCCMWVLVHPLLQRELLPPAGRYVDWCKLKFHRPRLSPLFIIYI